MNEVLRIEGISKRYQAKNGEVEALKDVNFTVNEGELVSLIGPSRLWKVYATFCNCRLRDSK